MTAPTSYGYQWKRNGTAISGATAATYPLVSADQTHTITCTVTGSNTAGSAAVTTAATPTIGASPTVVQSLANVGWGMYNHNGDGGWASDLTQAEGVTGRHMDIVMDYCAWSSGNMPEVSSQILGGIGARPMLWTVQPQSGISWATLVAGGYNANLESFATWAEETVANVIYLRFAHEQNGGGTAGSDYYPWQVGGACGVSSAADWADGFNAVASIMHANTSKIKMVWAANNGPTNNIASFYPSGCDIMGFDTYNFGPNGGGNTPQTTWAAASSLNAAAYAAVASCNSTKPIWICETSCEEPDAQWIPGNYAPGETGTIPAQSGVDKGTWVTDFLAETDMPRISMVVWFDTQKERNWLFDSSPGSTSAFYNGFSESRSGGVYWNQATGGLS